MNAATDNPLVFPEGEVISQGNFHGEPVAMAMDHLTLALSEMGSISERRLDKLMNPVFSGLPAFLVGKGQEAGLNSGFMIAHYTAASLCSENKTLAHPASADSIPTSNDKEDHVSMGATAARHAAQVLKNVQWIVSAELLAAAEGLEHRQGLQPGQGVWIGYQALRRFVSPLSQDRSLHHDIHKIVAFMELDLFYAKLLPLLSPTPEKFKPWKDLIF
jgi:histidine ammonia-lyase